MCGRPHVGLGHICLSGSCRRHHGSDPLLSKPAAASHEPNIKSGTRDKPLGLKSTNWLRRLILNIGLNIGLYPQRLPKQNPKFALAQVTPIQFCIVSCESDREYARDCHSLPRKRGTTLFARKLLIRQQTG